MNITTYQFYLLQNDEWKILHGWDRPFHDVEKLDDTLDYGSFTMRGVRRNPNTNPIKPFTRLKIEVYKNDILVDTIHRLIISVSVTRRTYDNPETPLFDWAIETVELTKLLEREVCDSMTVTNYLAKYYEGGTSIAYGTLDQGGYTYDITSKNAIKTPYQKGTTITIPSAKDAIKLPDDTLNQIFYTWPASDHEYSTEDTNYALITKPDGSTIKTEWFTPYNFVLDMTGTYKIVYHCLYRQQNFGTTGYNYRNFTMEYDIGVFENIGSYTDWTITSVVNRLLSAGRTRREGIEAQKYVFDATQAAEYESVKSPEFFFTRSTLFEALLQVGNYIHAIPRLIDNDGVLTVKFDKLGGTEEVDTTKLPPLEYQDMAQSSDDYCGSIDSHVENILNTSNQLQGTVSEPDILAYKTVRCEESSVEISPDTMIILTQYPIYQIVKVECGYLSDGTLVGDITPYIYEAAEYSALSSYWGSAYPYSKGWALKYTQGENKITGLNFRLTGTTSAGTAFTQKYSIINIIKAKTGIELDEDNLINLAFRVTYKPIISARVTQRKAYKGWDLDNTLIYNQDANSVESDLYGKKLKGLMLRVGNATERRTYSFTNYNKIPKCGQILDGKYICAVEKEFDRKRIKVTLTLTPNFNKIAENVAIKSNFRLYDISEKQSVDRYINYGENIIVSHEKIEGYSLKTVISDYGLVFFLFSLRQTISGFNYGTVSAALLYGKNGTSIETLTALAANAFAVGNSIAINCKYQDNYGADYQSNDDFKESNKTITKRVQRLVRYSNSLGRIEKLNFKFGHGLWTPSYSSQEDGGAANNYPETSNLTVDYFNTRDNPLLVDKDSREALSITYQLHLISVVDSIVIGNALTEKSVFVAGMDISRKAILYWLPKKLSKLTQNIDVSELIASELDVNDITIAGDFENDPLLVGSVETKYIKIFGLVNDSGTDAKAWALINPEDNTLYLGENIDVAAGESAPDVYLNFVDNRYKI